MKLSGHPGCVIVSVHPVACSLQVCASLAGHPHMPCVQLHLLVGHCQRCLHRKVLAFTKQEITSLMGDAQQDSSRPTDQDVPCHKLRPTTISTTSSFLHMPCNLRRQDAARCLANPIHDNGFPRPSHSHSAGRDGNFAGPMPVPCTAKYKAMIPALLLQCRHQHHQSAS